MPYIDVRNESPVLVFVCMDTHREEHDIAPARTAKFSKFNWGDLPTFRAFQSLEDMTQFKNEINSKKVSPKALIPFSGYPDYKWTGSSFEEM